MKRYVLALTLLCVACVSTEERIAAYREKCTTLYGYQTPDMIAQCIKELDEKEEANIRRVQRDLQRDMHRKDEKRKTEQEALLNAHKHHSIENQRWQREKEAEIRKKEREYRLKYPPSVAEDMIRLEWSSYN